jgi:hypothetical protein
MRVSRVALACSVVGSLLVAPMAPQASAGAVRDCVTQYLDAILEAAAPPSLDEVVWEEDGTLHVDGDTALTYGNVLVVLFAAHTIDFGACLNRESIDFLNEGPDCIAATPGWQNLSNNPPHARYVKTVGLEIQIDYGTLLADAQAVVDCL